MDNSADVTAVATGSAPPAGITFEIPTAIRHAWALHWLRVPILVLAMSLAACSTTSTRPSRPAEPVTADGGERGAALASRPTPSATAPTSVTPPRPDVPGPTSRRGGYYMDDGPGDNPPTDLAAIPNAQPRREALSTRANRPYVVFGRSYQPMTALQPYRQRGHASWYGRKFHGQKTSNGEIYDMYAMTAAHPTLPIPSFARVTNVANGEQVIVRINDRGPFLQGRIIDLSYTAAAKLGYIRAGSAEVEVELLDQLDQAPIEQVAANRAAGRSIAAVPASATTTTVASAQAAAVTAMPAAAAREPGDERLVVETTLVSESPVAETLAPIAQSPANPAVGNAVNSAQNPPQIPPQSPASPAAAVKVAAVTTVTSPTASATAATSLPASSSASAKPAQAYLQLGAFSSRENAEAIRTRLASQLDWLRQPLEIVGDGRLFRLVTGPFVTRDDSAAAAQRIQRSTGTLPFTTLR